MDNFVWESYVEKYEDLRNNGITTEETARDHWVNHGKTEGRSFDKLNMVMYFHTFNGDLYIQPYVLKILDIFKKLNYKIIFYTNSGYINGYHNFEINYIDTDENIVFEHKLSELNKCIYSNIIKLNDSVILPINGVNIMEKTILYYNIKYDIWSHFSDTISLDDSFISISNFSEYENNNDSLNSIVKFDNLNTGFDEDNKNWVYRNNTFALKVDQFKYLPEYNRYFNDFENFKLIVPHIKHDYKKNLFMFYIDDINNIKYGNSNTTVNIIEKLKRYLTDINIVPINLNDDINEIVKFISIESSGQDEYLFILNHHSLDYHPSNFSFNNFYEFIPKRKTYLYTFWELDTIHENLSHEIKNIDVILVSSYFNKKTYETYINDNKLNCSVEYVRYFDYSMIKENVDIKIKEKLGWSNKIVFFLNFSFNSDENRKNPTDVLNIFLKLLETNRDIKLIIKSVPTGLLFKGENEHLDKIFISDKICKCPDNIDIFHLNDYINTNEINSLHKYSDFYFSLQRSEGLGLTFLKSIEYGKHCITTNYSSIVEFLNDDNSTLIDYELKNIDIVDSLNHVYRIKNAKWAFPNLDDCYDKIIELLNNYVPIENKIKNTFYEYMFNDDFNDLNDIFI